MLVVLAAGTGVLVAALVHGGGSSTPRTAAGPTAPAPRTSKQRSFLALNGCDELQGELISKPLPAAEFERWVIARRGRMTARG